MCKQIWIFPHRGHGSDMYVVIFIEAASDGCFSCSQYVKVAITSSIFVMEILGQNHAFYSNWHLASVASHVIIIRSIIIMLELLPTLDHDFLGQIAQSSISLVGHSSLVHNRFYALAWQWGSKRAKTKSKKIRSHKTIPTSSVAHIELNLSLFFINSQYFENVRQSSTTRHIFLLFCNFILERKLARC